MHGFSECSDTWFEMGYQLALNNFDVHMVDLEGYGWSAGTRGKGPKIPNLHFNVTVLIEQFREGVPTFLWGNSMGCMVLNTFLLQNPHLKLNGVVFGSPFFEISEELELDSAKRFVLSTLAEGLEVSYRLYSLTHVALRSVRGTPSAHDFPEQGILPQVAAADESYPSPRHCRGE